jgi:hypothetical protein
VIADSADFAARAIISRSTSVRFMQHVLQAIHSTRAPVACCKCAEYVSLCLKHWRPQDADRLGDVLDSAIVAAVQSATADARQAGRKAALLLKTILPDRYRWPLYVTTQNLFRLFCCRRVWDMIDCSNQKLLAREEQVVSLSVVRLACVSRDSLCPGRRRRPRQQRREVQQQQQEHAAAWLPATRNRQLPPCVQG